ncbi:MAG: rhomboid family intramembrane serine protease [Desulfamplus sp.]|nr:rhomboid family intramembrane serine protease [Desulfamplus sp.]
MKKIKELSQDTFIKWIVGINALFFIISLILSGSEATLTLNPFNALSPSLEVLVAMGASGTLPIDEYGHWWSLIAAGWLHGSLIHILFNMAALYHIGRLIIMTYGIERMSVIYIVSCIAGFYLSYIAGVSLTIGASASLCGLIGAAFHYGRTSRGPFARAVSETASGWIISIAIIGIALPGINNWGHGGGFAAGFLLARLMGHNDTSRGKSIHVMASWISFIATGAVFVWSLISIAK